MNNEVVLPTDVVKKEREPKPAVPKATKASKPRPAAKEAAPKKTRKAMKKAERKTTKPTAKKPLQRRKFPYQQVLLMWKAGKTLETIARAVGRYQKNADDPLHGFRVSLTRFHKGVNLNGRLVKLPHRVSNSSIKMSRKAGKKAAA
jgi:hypothetical protein